MPCIIKKQKAIEMELLPLFLMQGVPVILQSAKGWEFMAKIIGELLKV
jgi:hypothetical protein